MGRGTVFPRWRHMIASSGGVGNEGCNVHGGSQVDRRAVVFHTGGESASAYESLLQGIRAFLRTGE